ncbi:poly(beta-D-mannuronate) lyase [Sphingopyxis sp. PAMC25046]|uniref:chondroitinase-B domain-containing protein n=1 Tax=Sphingopyxis sp. PAMC25046 TaxID=2565556 RepID=UPI00109DAEE1|nr:chondroitinase-B domain-containing protein [Sphingopyxis sp. PAMC25046]QCB54152.1 poly(beta-D-mannuronate) lyase [Sphingopyxis sp. PAMC25046]
MLVSTAHPALARDLLVADQAQYRAAVKKAQPGDNIILADGEWRDFQIVFTGAGTAAKPIVLTAQTMGKVLITGQSSLRIGGKHLLVSGLVFKNGASPTDQVISFRRDSKTLATDSRVTETVIDGFSKSDRRAEDIWVALYGTGNRVDHSHFEGKTNAGVTLAVIRRAGDPLDNGHRIDHNYFGPRPPLGSNGGETIRIGTSEESLSDSHTIVERNIFDRTSGEVEIVSIKSGGNIIRENLVLEAQGAFVLRHGNGNLVERNIFFGKGVPDTGGVRVINRDQIVRDNYFEGLAGGSFKSAIAVMNGVPNSVINRYHQVANARIERNSLIDIARITLAAGADAERSAPPVDSKFERNLIVGAKGADPFRAEGEIGGITFAGNVQAKAARPLLTAGVEQRDVALERAANGLLYPTDPALAAVGAPRDLKPVSREEVGASWYRGDAPEAAFGAGATRPIAAGASLAEAVADANAGDTLALATGTYDIAAPLAVQRRLTIAGAKDAKPVLRVASSLARIAGGGGLRLENLAVDASAASGEDALIAVASGVAPNYSITLDRVSVRGPGKGRLDGIAMAPGTFADDVTITNSDFAAMGVVVAATGEQEPKGWYPMERLTIAGSRFARVAMVADLLRKGTDESTFGPWFAMTGSSVAGSGKGGASLRVSGAQHTDIAQNSFAKSDGIVVIHSVGAPETRIASNAFAATPAPRIEELAWKGPPRGQISGNVVEGRP